MEGLQYGIIVKGLTKKIILNGDVLNSGSIQGTFVFEKGSFVIGKSNRGSMNGLFHSMMVYNRALSADEVAHNYAIDKSRFNLT